MATFPVMRLFWMDADPRPPMWIPPVFALMSIPLANELTTLEVLLLTTLFLTTNASPSCTKMPAPSAKRPFGADTVAVLPVTVELMSVSSPGPPLVAVQIPPPAPLLAEPPPAVLLLTVVLISVSLPTSAIPPPKPPPNRQFAPPGHGSPESTVDAGLARLPVIRLLRIVTVAPTPVADPGM